MIDPVLMTVAAALAGKAVAVVAEGGRNAWAALVGLVRSEFSGDPVAEEVFDAASSAPEDGKRVERLGEQLARAEQANPEFGRQVRELWERAQLELRAESGGVVNQVSGVVDGNVVQARDIQGGVTFG